MRREALFVSIKKGDNLFCNKFKRLMIVSITTILLLTILSANSIGTSEWDLNEDGYCNVLDMEHLTGFYGMEDAPGWIREDLNNDGIIDLLDLVLLGSHCGSEGFSEVNTKLTFTGTTNINIIPLSQLVGPGKGFMVSVYCVPGQPIKSFEFDLDFDASLIQAILVTEGNIFGVHDTWFNDGTIDNTGGYINNIYNLITEAVGNVSDPGYLANISFISLSSTGESLLELMDIGVTNETGYVPIAIENGGAQVDPWIDSDDSDAGGTTGDLYNFDISADDNINVASVNVSWSHGVLSGNVALSFGTSWTGAVTLDDDIGNWLMILLVILLEVGIVLSLFWIMMILQFLVLML